MILERWLPGFIKITAQEIGQRQYSNIVRRLSKTQCEKTGETVKTMSLGMQKTSHRKGVSIQCERLEGRTPGNVCEVIGCRFVPVYREAVRVALCMSSHKDQVNDR